MPSQIWRNGCCATTVPEGQAVQGTRGWIVSALRLPSYGVHGGSIVIGTPLPDGIEVGQTPALVQLAAVVAEAEREQELEGPASPASRNAVGRDEIDHPSPDQSRGLLRKPAVAHGDNRWKTLDDGRVVAHQYDRLPMLGRKGSEKARYGEGVLGVQVPCGFICQDQGRIVG